jgi:integration host factor subunit beta
MATITKQQLIYRISESSGQKKVVTKEVIQSFIDEIISELGKGNRLEFREFGVFELKERAPRKARNPQTGESVYVPAKRVVHFKPGRLMKEKVLGLAKTETATTTTNTTGSTSTGTQKNPY